MRTLAIAAKAARDQLRNLWLPLLVIALGPFFVALTSLFFPAGGSTSYPIVVVNSDTGPTGAQVVSALEKLSYDSGDRLLNVAVVADVATAKAAVTARHAVVFMVIPPEFSAEVATAAQTARSVPITFGGDMGSPTYPVAAILTAQVVEAQVQQVSGRAPLLQISEVSVGVGARTEFELYVPGVLIFAIGIMLFSAAMSIAQEIESGTVNRLIRSRASAWSILGGHALVQVVLALLAGTASLGVAVALGFHSAGPLWLAIPIWILTSLGVIGLGMLVAAYSRSVAQAFLMANLPFGLFMFLSGTVFPLQGWSLFTIAGQEINALDVLPTRHAVTALTAVFSYGSTAIGYQLTALAVLSLGFFAAGALAFRHRHLRLAS
jgi:ABC-type transport system involved in multi-copper enzyme maturation permease subunit